MRGRELLTLLVGMCMCACAYARCGNVSFVFLPFFFSFCLKDTAFQEPFFFCVLAHALSESLMHVCVCVCVCVSMAAKSEQQQRPPPKKSETWLPSAPQNAKDAVDAFLSPPRFFFLPPFFLLSFLFLRWFVAIFSAQKKKKKKEANVDDDDDDDEKKKKRTTAALFQPFSLTDVAV